MEGSPLSTIKTFQNEPACFPCHGNQKEDSRHPACFSPHGATIQSIRFNRTLLIISNRSLPFSDGSGDYLLAYPVGQKSHPEAIASMSQWKR